MSGAANGVLMAIACLSAGASAGTAGLLYTSRWVRAKRRAAALGAQGGPSRVHTAANLQNWTLVYAERLTRGLFTGATEPLAPSVRSKRAGRTRAGSAYKAMANQAGCSKDISVSAFCEATMRLTFLGAIAGGLFGLLLSTELALLLAVAGAVLFHALPSMAVRRLVRQRALGAELHLSEMLEVVALGLRSGMTFDRSFALYGAYFDHEFAQSCVKAYRRWSLGLSSREDSLRELAASYDCEQLSQVTDSIVRSLRFGSALAGILEEASVQSRAAYRATLEEKVAKAPVKMMVPTGTLILPAMLLMVMGPILLELASGF